MCIRDSCNGGKIQYVRYPIGYNKEAIRTLIRRAMNLGYYEGVNLSLAYCCLLYTSICGAPSSQQSGEVSRPQIYRLHHFWVSGKIKYSR